MVSKRVVHIGFSAIVSSMITITAAQFSHFRANSYSRETTAKWARQIATQADALILQGKEIGKSDPISWTVSVLAQGDAARPFQISKIQVPDPKENEILIEDEKRSSLELTKISSPLDGLGVRIRIPFEPARYFGAKTQLECDLYILFFFFGMFALFYLATASQFQSKPKEEPTGSMVLDWIREAKSSLAVFGTQFKELIRKVNALGAIVAKSRSALTQLRSGLHHEIHEIRKARKALKLYREKLSRAESIALNAVIEANRLGRNGANIIDATGELHELIASLRRNNDETIQTVSRIERDLEPWVVDADIAFHAYDDFAPITEGIGTGIRSTNDALFAQAKAFRRIQDQIKKWSSAA